MSNPNPTSGSGARLLLIIAGCLIIGYYLGANYGPGC